MVFGLNNSTSDGCLFILLVLNNVMSAKSVRDSDNSADIAKSSFVCQPRGKHFPHKIIFALNESKPLDRQRRMFLDYV